VATQTKATKQGDVASQHEDRPVYTLLYRHDLSRRWDSDFS